MNYPLQVSSHLSSIPKDIKVIGQPSKLVEPFDDKNFVNDMLRARPGFTFLAAEIICNERTLENALSKWSRYLVVGKPVRG